MFLHISWDGHFLWLLTSIAGCGCIFEDGCGGCPFLFAVACEKTVDNSALRRCQSWRRRQCGLCLC
jgi:hypothetical protein